MVVQTLFVRSGEPFKPPGVDVLVSRSERGPELVEHGLLVGIEQLRIVDGCRDHDREVAEFEFQAPGLGEGLDRRGCL